MYGWYVYISHMFFTYIYIYACARIAYMLVCIYTLIGVSTIDLKANFVPMLIVFLP